MSKNDPITKMEVDVIQEFLKYVFPIDAISCPSFELKNCQKGGYQRTKLKTKMVKASKKVSTTQEKPSLFNIEEQEPDWKQEWKGMPEFVQDKQKAYSQIIFRFDNEEDLQAFAKLIGQKLTNKTKSAWFPFKSHWGGVKKVWTDEK